MSEIDALIWIRDNMSCGFLDSAMPAVSLSVTADIIWFAASLLLMVRKDTRRIGAVLFLAEVLCIILGNVILKNVFERPRPFDAYPFELIVTEPSDWSFPSGHTAGSFAAATVALMHSRKIGYAMLAYAAVVGFSRLYLCVHYPSDVFGGAMLGVLCAVAARLIIDRITEGDGYGSGGDRQGVR